MEKRMKPIYKRGNMATGNKGKGVSMQMEIEGTFKMRMEIEGKLDEKWK
jgi:hypothetical protein